MVVGDDLFRRGEPQSGSRRFCAEHEIEDLRQMFFRYTHSVILDDDEDILL